MQWLVLILLAGVSCGDREWKWGFDHDTPGEEPDGFYFDETGRAPDGKWRVVEDDNHKVLAQLDRSREGDRYALAVVEDSSIKDVKVSVRMKAVKGDIDQAGGVMWRYRNSENYLVARLDISERNVRLYRFVRGHRIQFGVKGDLDVQLGEWYKLRVEHEGREIKVYLNDDVLIVERDRHFTRPGRIGLWTKSDSVIYFDDLYAKNLNDD